MKMIERRLKCGLELKGVSYTLKDDFKCPTEAQALAATQGGSIQKRYEDNVKAKVLIQIATDDVANDLIEDVELARDMKKILDREFKLGNKDYDLDFLVNQFDSLSLDIKTNPRVFFTTLTKLNKRFNKFSVTGGKDYTRDDKELYIKICNSVGEEYKDVTTAFKTSHIKVTDGKEKLQSLKDILKEQWKENYSHLYQGNKNSSEQLITNANTSHVPTCGFCGRKGHSENKCWKKHGKPEKEKYVPRCWICGSTEHLKKECPEYKKNRGNGDAVNNETSMNGIFLGMALCGDNMGSNGNEEKWLGDTGSQIRATGNVSMRVRNQKVLNNEPVKGCSGKIINATTSGNVTVKTDLRSNV